jgi:hypothetical protein
VIWTISNLFPANLIVPDAMVGPIIEIGTESDGGELLREIAQLGGI